MVAVDIAILSGFGAFWWKASHFCFNTFSCPEHLNPKNNNGKKTKQYYDYYGNYVSIAHAILSMILCSIAIITEGLSFGKADTLIVKIAIYNSFAYFIYDTIISEYYRYNTLAMSLHHVGAILCTGAVFWTGANGIELAVALTIAESSNPFNLFREILRHKKKESTSLYFKTSLIFASLFIFSRFIILPIFLTKLYPSQSHIFLKSMIAFVWFVSWHWLFVIFNFVVKEIKVFSESNDKKSNQANIWKIVYGILSGLRKNKAFLIAFYAGSAWLSFGMLYLSHKGN